MDQVYDAYETVGILIISIDINFDTLIGIFVRKGDGTREFMRCLLVIIINIYS